jgi:hypothetical protein
MALRIPAIAAGCQSTDLISTPPALQSTAASKIASNARRRSEIDKVPFMIAD